MFRRKAYLVWFHNECDHSRLCKRPSIQTQTLTTTRHLTLLLLCLISKAVYLSAFCLALQPHLVTWIGDSLAFPPTSVVGLINANVIDDLNALTFFFRFPLLKKRNSFLFLGGDYIQQLILYMFISVQKILSHTKQKDILEFFEEIIY